MADEVLPDNSSILSLKKTVAVLREYLLKPSTSTDYKYVQSIAALRPIATLNKLLSYSDVIFRHNATKLFSKYYRTFYFLTESDSYRFYVTKQQGQPVKSLPTLSLYNRTVDRSLSQWWTHFPALLIRSESGYAYKWCGFVEEVGCGVLGGQLRFNNNGTWILEEIVVITAKLIYLLSPYVSPDRPYTLLSDYLHPYGLVLMLSFTLGLPCLCGGMFGSAAYTEVLRQQSLSTILCNGLSFPTYIPEKLKAGFPYGVTSCDGQYVVDGAMNGLYLAPLVLARADYTYTDLSGVLIGILSSLLLRKVLGVYVSFLDSGYDGSLSACARLHYTLSVDLLNFNNLVPVAFKHKKALSPYILVPIEQFSMYPASYLQLIPVPERVSLNIGIPLYKLKYYKSNDIQSPSMRTYSLYKHTVVLLVWNTDTGTYDEGMAISLLDIYFSNKRHKCVYLLIALNLTQRLLLFYLIRPGYRLLLNYDRWFVLNDRLYKYNLEETEQSTPDLALALPHITSVHVYGFLQIISLSGGGVRLSVIFDKYILCPTGLTCTRCNCLNSQFPVRVLNALLVSTSGSYVYQGSSATVFNISYIAKSRFSALRAAANSYLLNLDILVADRNDLYFVSEFSYMPIWSTASVQYTVMDNGQYVDTSGGQQLIADIKALILGIQITVNGTSVQILALIAECRDSLYLWCLTVDGQRRCYIAWIYRLCFIRAKIALAVHAGDIIQLRNRAWLDELGARIRQKSYPGAFIKQYAVVPSFRGSLSCDDDVLLLWTIVNVPPNSLQTTVGNLLTSGAALPYVRAVDNLNLD